MLTKGKRLLNAVKKIYKTITGKDSKSNDLTVVVEGIADNYEGGSGGSTVVANPTLAGTEANLTGLEIDGTKYKVPSGGGTVYKNIISIYPHKENLTMTLRTETISNFNFNEDINIIPNSSGLENFKSILQKIYQILNSKDFPIVDEYDLICLTQFNYEGNASINYIDNGNITEFGIGTTYIETNFDENGIYVNIKDITLQYTDEWLLEEHCDSSNEALSYTRTFDDFRITIESIAL